MEIASKEVVSEVISTFKCSYDNDIENFLREKATLFDYKGKSKTHLILDQDELEKGSIVIVAYFSLAIHLRQRSL